MPNRLNLQKIFSAPEVKHGLSLFNSDEINVIERSIIEQEGKYFIKCQIKNRNKIAKPEEIIRQLWIYRLLSKYNYPKKRIGVKKNHKFWFSNGASNRRYCSFPGGFKTLSYL